MRPQQEPCPGQRSGTWRERGALGFRGMEMPSSQETSKLDPWTVGAIAVVAYALSNMVHEGVGHGGACVLVGGRPEALNAVFFECSVEGLASAAGRWLAAGGSIANLVFAALAWMGTRK